MILSLHDYWLSLQLRVSIDNQQTPTHGPAMVPTAHFFVFCLAYIWSPCFATMPGPPLRWKDHKFNLGVLVNPHFLELTINNNFFLTINYCWMFPFPMQAQTETNGKRDIRARYGARECVLHALRARYSRAMAHGTRFARVLWQIWQHRTWQTPLSGQ